MSTEKRLHQEVIWGDPEIGALETSYPSSFHFYGKSHRATIGGRPGWIVGYSEPYIERVDAQTLVVFDGETGVTGIHESQIVT